MSMSAFKPAAVCLALLLPACVNSGGGGEPQPNCVVVRYENNVRHEVCNTAGRVELRETGTAPAAVSARYLQSSIRAAMPQLEAQQAQAPR